MNIFSNLRQYQKPPRVVQPPTEDELRQEKKKQIKEYVKGALFIMLFLLILGCLWWFAELKYAGAAFFFCLGMLIFGIVTSTFAKITDLYIKWWGEDKGLSVGCLAMALGPMLGILVFVSSMPFWDLKERTEIENSPKVYITPHGECYHSSEDCYTIKGHKIKEIPQYKAVKNGRRPCGICH